MAFRNLFFSSMERLETCRALFGHLWIWKPDFHQGLLAEPASVPTWRKNESRGLQQETLPHRLAYR